jgi:hypothetical protein
MISVRFILSQILDLIHRETLSRLASRFQAETRVRHFGVRQPGQSFAIDQIQNLRKNKASSMHPCEQAV